MRLLRELTSTPERVLDELASYGPVCALGGGPLRMAVVGAPDAIRELLAMPADRFRYDVPLSPFPTVVGSRSMLVSDGEDHHRRRGAVAGSLSRRSLARWIPMIVDRTDAAVDALVADLSSREGMGASVVDLYPIGRRLVLDIVVRALFGAGLVDRLDEIDALQHSGQRFLGSPLWRQWSPMPFGVRRTARRDRDSLDAVIDAAIAAVRATEVATDGAGAASDVLAQLVLTDVLDDAEIRDQVKTLIGAGFDTTASTLAWTLWEATLCDGLWSRLRREADAVLGRDGEPDEITLASLTVAAATVREALRLHPASGVAARSTATAISVGGHAIARNTIVLWSPYLAGRDPAVWDDPLRFDPNRFLASEPTDEPIGQVRRAIGHEAWLPFGRGARMCVGFALAQMELTLITARLAQRLDVAATTGAPPPARGLVVSVPDGGAPMRVHPRRPAFQRAQEPNL